MLISILLDLGQLQGNFARFINNFCKYAQCFPFSENIDLTFAKCRHNLINIEHTNWNS